MERGIAAKLRCSKTVVSNDTIVKFNVGGTFHCNKKKTHVVVNGTLRPVRPLNESDSNALAKQLLRGKSC